MIAPTTWSTGTMSTTESGAAGNSGSSPRPKARISGSAILKPSIHPGYGVRSADSMMLGRTMLTGLAAPRDPRSGPAACSSTTRSPIDLVKV